MDKGIRNRARHLFVEMNEKRRRGEYGVTKRADTVFRLGLCCTLVEEFGITMPAAGAAYQEAFKFVKNLNSELVDGLGRPADKNNGGRKKKVALTVQEVTAPVVDELTPDLGEQQTVFTVKKKSDGSVVAENLSYDDARALVEKAERAKKAKLYWI